MNNIERTTDYKYHLCTVEHECHVSWIADQVCEMLPPDVTVRVSEVFDDAQVEGQVGIYASRQLTAKEWEKFEYNFEHEQDYTDLAYIGWYDPHEGSTKKWWLFWKSRS